MLTEARDWDTTRLQMAGQFEVDDHVLERDRDAFAARCLADRLLEPVGSDPDATPTGSRRSWRARLPGSVHALILLYATASSLARRGMAETYALSARQPEATGADIGQALGQFGRAEHLFVSRRGADDCLVRSLALFRFLRERGVPAEHVIGVCRLPFQAHAWVESGGATLLDAQGRSGIFTEIARLA